MLTTDELFSNRHEVDSFHDAVVDALGFARQLTDEGLRFIFVSLPESARGIAHMWGLSDTPFRDGAYVYLKENSFDEIA